MSIGDRLFIIVPAMALICNAFLFMSVMSAKKDKVVRAFCLLLLTFTAWTCGSLCMRLTLWPSVYFWFELSLNGIFCVPFFYYNFMHYYVGEKGTFVRNLLGVAWAIIVSMNFFDVFIKHPYVLNAAGERFFDVTMTWLVAIPLLFALFTFVLIGRMVYVNVKEQGTPKSYFSPLILGIAVMFLTNLADVIPALSFFPNDTFGCMVNAVCMYYALWKKRLITLQHLTSRSPIYLISAAFTTIILSISYSTLDRFYTENFAAYISYKPVVFAAVYSILTLAIYSLVRVCIDNIFVKNQAARETDLKDFSQAITKSLDMDEIVSAYRDFIHEYLPESTAYIFVWDAERRHYAVASCTEKLRSAELILGADNPLVKWLEKYDHGVMYSEFQRTSTYKSMWESEKNQMAAMGAELIIPITRDGSLTGITIFSGSGRAKAYTHSNLNFMESASAILSIALKNASLYTTMQREAQLDSLTNIYNRRYFTEQIKRDFDAARNDSMVLMMFSFDDFQLYNELYGTQEGDVVLKKFAGILTSVIGRRGTVARYVGKEFAVSLPFCDVRTASQFAQDVRDGLNRVLNDSGETTKKFLTCSVGIAAYPTAASNLDELLTFMNMAVYSAKKNGKNRVVVYAESEDGSGMVQAEQGPSAWEIGENCAATIYALTAAIDAKDHYTFNHSRNVSEYATVLAQAIGLDKEHVEIIRQAGILHDIGKIGVPETILSKNGKLDDSEYTMMKQHVEGSIAMIKYLPSLDYVIPSAIGHHERWDGHGYPRGIKGEDIPIGARCLCLADSFDAMTSNRPYRTAMPVEKALDEIRRNLGTQFDPQLGVVFIDLVTSGRIKVHGV